MYGYEPGAVWPVTDDENILTREVYARFGLAMYMAQVLEHGMVNAAIVLHTLPTISKHSDRDSWISSLEQAFQAGLKLTYGNLLKPLKASSQFPPALYDRLSAAKEDRDILAHRFFRLNDLAFMSREGRTSMIVWCEERVELFKSLSDDLDDFLIPFQSRYGITHDWLEAAWQQTMADAERWPQEHNP